MSDAKDKELEKILNFYVNNPKFDELTKKLNEFNPLKILGIKDFEIRHSNMLAWLLNPKGHHGLQDKIFKRIICEILKENNQEGLCNGCSNKNNSGICKNSNENDILNINDIILSDFSDLEIRREWNNIDVVAISKKNEVIVVIENKYISSESSNQLMKYYNFIHSSIYKDYKKLFIFLTLDGKEPLGCKRYLVFTHKQIFNILKNIVDINAEYINQKVYDFIDYYLKVLEEKSMSDQELINICKIIYKEHKEAIDLIVEYGKARIPQAIMDVFHSQTNTKSIYFDDPSKDSSKTNIYYVFIPEEWASIVPTTNKYTSDKYLITFSFDFSEMDRKKIKLRLDVGNFKNIDVRTKFMDILNKKLSEKGLIKRISSATANSRLKSINIDIKDIDIENYDEIISVMVKAYNNEDMKIIKKEIDTIIITDNFDFSEETNA